jgi:hypothetical protein
MVGVFDNCLLHPRRDSPQPQRDAPVTARRNQRRGVSLSLPPPERVQLNSRRVCRIAEAGALAWTRAPESLMIWVISLRAPALTKLQLDTVNRSHDETAKLAAKVVGPSQTLRQQWPAADYTAKRRLLEFVFLKAASKTQLWSPQ